MRKDLFLKIYYPDETKLRKDLFLKRACLAYISQAKQNFPGEIGKFQTELLENPSPFSNKIQLDIMMNLPDMT